MLVLELMMGQSLIVVKIMIVYIDILAVLSEFQYDLCMLGGALLSKWQQCSTFESELWQCVIYSH